MVFVNDNCISCGVCEFAAPTIFKIESGMSHVVKQPETQEEKDATQNAISSCPVGAIQE